MDVSIHFKTKLAVESFFTPLFPALTGKRVKLFAENWERIRSKLLDCASTECCPKGNAAAVGAKIEEARQAGISFGKFLIGICLFFWRCGIQ